MKNSLSNIVANRSVIKVPVEWPLLGHIAFGLIDRGTNVIQVRPITTCPLCCVFCSVDAGPCSRNRQSEYIVELDHLIEWFKSLVAYKGLDRVQAHIDTVGDPLTYPELVDLVHALSDIKEVSVISLETHGPLLTEKIVEDLESAGLTRINLSIDSLNPELARRLANANWFNVNKVLAIAEYIAKNTKLDLIITPVWVPKLNDQEIPKIIRFALNIGAGKRCPPLGIQKYEAHKYGRKPRGIRPMSWREFYSKLRQLERIHGVKLVLRPDDFGIHKAVQVPLKFRRYEVAKVKVVEQGWLRGQVIGIARNRIVSIVGLRSSLDMSSIIGQRVRVKMLRVKHNIYVATLA